MSKQGGLDRNPHVDGQLAGGLEPEWARRMRAGRGNDGGVIRFVVHSRNPPILVHVAATILVTVGNQWQGHAFALVGRK